MKIILWCVLACVSTVGAWAQSVAGSGVVSGVVVDSYGRGMPDAKVILENQATSVSRVMRTSSDGVFEAAGLVPAPGYRLQVSHERYQDWKSNEFEVQVGERLSFKITLPAEEGAQEDGAKKEEGAKAGNAGLALPLVDPTTSSVGAVIGARQIDTLPAAQRRWDSLVLLAPAVTANLPLGALAIRGDASSNAYFTDGLLTSNGYAAGRSAPPAGRVAQDAVQGFEVLSSAAPVEFGHAMGGVVNAVTRGGSNGYHGGAYEYFSNDSLNAVPRYALGHNLFRKSDQTGFNLGGAIFPGRLFFFSNLEISDAQGQGLNRITNPLIADSSGTSAAPSNCTASAARCATAIRFIQNQMNALVPRSEHEVTGLAKIDYRRSDRNTFSFAVYATHSRTPVGGSGVEAVSADGGLLGNAISRQDTHYEKIEWISAPASNAGNELRLGWFQDRIANGASTSGLSTGNLALSIAGVTMGEPHPDSGILSERRRQIVDNLRVSSGSHTFMVGVDWATTRDWIDVLANAGGAYYYSSLTAFANDLTGFGRKYYSFFARSFGNPIRDLGMSELGFYAQDAWKITPRLQVTCGLRWSKPRLPQPTQENSTYYQTGYVNSPNTNADPRIGASYMLNGRTVVRASFGMFHAPNPGEMVDALFLGNGLYQISAQINPLQTGAPFFPALIPSTSIPNGTSNLMYALAKARNPYTKQSTVVLERYLGGGVTLSASYLGSRGVKLWTAEDMNLAAPTNTVAYTINDASGQPVGAFSTPLWTARNNGNYAHIFQVDNGGSSWYRAVVLQLRKRMGHGFSAQASYTWSHAIDDTGGARVAGSIPWNSYNADHVSDRGSSATDQRQRAVFDWVWQPRVGKGNSLASRYLLNGWELSSVATLASPLPATALVVVNGQQLSGLTMAFPGSLNGSGGWSRVPFLPVNSLRADAQYTVNARLARSVPFSERITGKLVLEAFNLANNQFNTGVNTIAYISAGGVLTPVSGLGTGNAAQGYPSGTNARSYQVAFRLTF